MPDADRPASRPADLRDGAFWPAVDLFRLTPVQLAQIEHVAKVYGAAAALRREELAHQARGDRLAAEVSKLAVRTLRRRLPKWARWPKV